MRHLEALIEANEQPAPQPSREETLGFQSLADRARQDRLELRRIHAERPAYIREP